MKGATKRLSALVQSAKTRCVTKLADIDALRQLRICIGDEDYLTFYQAEQEVP